MRLKVQRHTGIFTYRGKKIRFNYWVHASPKTPTDTVVFQGSAQFGRISKWASLNAPSGTVVVDGLPHRAAQADGHELTEFSRNYTAAAFQQILATCNISSANVVAISQAAPGAVWLANNLSDRVRNIALVAPLGFTSSVLGSSPRARLKELKKRTAQTVLQFSQSPLYDLRNIYLGLIGLHTLLFDSRWEISGQKYAIGASYDLREDYRILASRQRQKGMSLTLFLAAEDKLFPPHEILDSIAAGNLKHADTEMLANTSHPSLAVRSGNHILHRVISVVRRESTY